MCRQLWRQGFGVDDNVGVLRLLIRIVNASDPLYDTGARLGIESLAIPLLADFQRRRHIDFYKAAFSLDALSHPAPGRPVGRYGRADCSAAILCDFRRHEADPQNVEIAMFLREPQPAGKVLADHIPVHERYPALSVLQQLEA